MISPTKQRFLVANGIVLAVFILHFAASSYYLKTLHAFSFDVTPDAMKQEGSFKLEHPNATPGTFSGRAFDVLSAPLFIFLAHRYLPQTAQALNSILFALLAYLLACLFARIAKMRKLGLSADLIPVVLLTWAVIAYLIVYSQRYWGFGRKTSLAPAIYSEGRLVGVVSEAIKPRRHWGKYGCCPILLRAGRTKV